MQFDFLVVLIFFLSGGYTSFDFVRNRRISSYASILAGPWKYFMIFCLDDLSRLVDGELRSPTMIVFLSIFPLFLLVVSLYISILPDWVHIY